VKIQTGVRLDRLIWQSFRKSCEDAKLKNNEVMEAFLKICVEKGVQATLDILRSQNTGEKLGYELKLRNKLVDLEVYYMEDKRVGKARNAGYVDGTINRISELLPKIVDSKLLEKTKRLTEEVLEYYRKMGIAAAGKEKSLEEVLKY
jgi:hypothetical protein